MNHSNRRNVKQIFLLSLSVATTKNYFTMSSSSFFDLCSDILLDIFQYFSLNELFDVFIELIPYLSTLLNQSHIKLCIDKNANEDFWNKILPKINSHQIIFVNISHLITNLSQFTSVRSINLNPQISSIFDQFQYLTHLEHLSLQLSETIIENYTWLCHSLTLPKLKKLKLDLKISKNILTPQKPISIDKSLHQSTTIKYLEIKIPMSWRSLLVFLNHFPNLQVFQATLYQINGPPTSTLNLPYFHSLQILNLQGYFHTMSSIVNYISSSMQNLKRCRLIAMNVTNDDAFSMKHGFIWKHLFEYCSYLIQVKIHLIMSIEIDNHFNIRVLKDLIRTFNNELFYEKYNFRMEQRSINRGYVTLTGDYDMRKKKRNSIDNLIHF